MTAGEGTGAVSVPTQRYTRDFAHGQKWVIIQDDEVAEDYVELARKLHKSGKLVRSDGLYVPNAFVGVSRGGSPIATYVSHVAKGIFGYPQRTFTMTSGSYKNRDQSKGIEITGMQELVENLRAGRHSVVCIIDDVFDTGRTAHAVRHIMKNGLQRITPNPDDRPYAKGIEEGFDTLSDHRVQEFLMQSGTETYTMTIPLTDDIKPLDPGIEVLIAVLHWKKDANMTDFGPDVCVDDTIGKDEWIVYPWGAPEDWEYYPDLLEKHYPKKYRRLFE